MPPKKKTFSTQSVDAANTIRKTKPKRRPKKTSGAYHSRIKKSKKQAIDKQLTDIYENGDGKIPNMKQIQIKKAHPFLRGLVIFILAGGFMAAIAWVGFFILPASQKFSETKLILKIEGPTELTVGATTTYTISFENNQNIRLKNTVLTINYPEGFIFSDSSKSANNAGHTEWLLDDLMPHSKDKITITGQTLGALDKEYSWTAFLGYQPANFNSGLQKIATLKIKINESPFSISVSGPDKITIGENAEYVFTIQNPSGWWPEILELVPTWPVNFYPASSSVALTKKNKWLIKKPSPTSSPALINGTEIKLKISGKFSDWGGTLTENLAKLSAALYLPSAVNMFSIAEGEIKSELVKNNYNFSMAINGSMTDLNSQPSDILNITLYLKNNGQETMKKASFKLILDSPSFNRRTALNWTDINDPLDGAIVGKQINDDIRRGTIRWTQQHLGTLSAIKPGQEISIDLQMPIRDSKIFDLASLVEYQVKAAAEISFLDKSGRIKNLTANPIIITLNSDLKFESRAAQSTESDGLEKREMHWIITNTFHPLKNIELSADLYGNVSFFTASPTPAGIVNFNPDTKKIIWRIAEMPQVVDVLALPFTVTINEMNPTQKTLISKVHIRAEDTITGKTLDFMGDETPTENDSLAEPNP